MEYTKIPFAGSMVLKFFNPLFNDIGSHSLPISLNGRIPYLKRAFGYPDSREAEIISPLEGRIKTQFLDIVGSWEVNEASEDLISAYFKVSSGDFYSRIKDVLLSDIDFGDVRWPVGHSAGWAAMLAHMDTKMSASYPDSEYAAFCAYMPNGVNLDNRFPAGFVNEVVLPEEGPMHFGNQFGNAAVYLFAGTVIEYLFTSNGYKIEENIFRKNPDLKRLVIFHTFNLHPPDQSEYSNKPRIDYKDLVPHISCGDFLKAIRNRFNIGFFINEQARSVKILSFDSIISDGNQFSVCSTRPKRPVVVPNRLTGLIFPLNEPDEWASHNYKSIAELSNPIVVVKYSDILPETRADGDLIFVQAESAYYKIKHTLDPDEWEVIRIGTDQFPYEVGKTPDEMPQLSGIPAMYTHTINQEYVYWVETTRIVGHTDVDYLVPRCDLVGNGYGQPFSDFPLMFLFARGVQDCYTPSGPDPYDPIQQYANLAAFPVTGSFGIRYLAIDSGLFYRWDGSYIAELNPLPEPPPTFTYPMGTCDIYGAWGGLLTGVTMALKWGGDYGLIKHFWTNRINWEMNIKKLIRAELLSDDISKLINMEEVKRIGDDNYLVNSFEIALEGKNVRLQNVELLRL